MGVWYESIARCNVYALYFYNYKKLKALFRFCHRNVGTMKSQEIKDICINTTKLDSDLKRSSKTSFPSTEIKAMSHHVSFKQSILHAYFNMQIIRLYVQIVASASIAVCFFILSLGLSS